MTIILTIIFIISLYLLWFYMFKTKLLWPLSKSIPGPMPWPLLGNIIQIGKADKVTFLALHKLQKDYGPVMRLWMGHNSLIVVSGREELKAVMNDPNFDDRGPVDKPSLLSEVYTGSKESKGILFNSGHIWQENRRFALKTLRDFGFGKITASSLIVEESVHMIAHVKSLMIDNEVIIDSKQLSELFTMMALNVVWQMSSNARYDYNSEEMLTLLRFIDYFNHLGSTFLTGILAAFPSLSALPPFRAERIKCESMMKELRMFLRKCIKEHRQNLNENKANDYIDAFLMKENKSAAFKEDQLVAVLMDLFLAGTETTAKALMWAVRFMISHPTEQKNVQKELDSVLKSDLVQISDRSQLPLTDATLQEVLRLGPVGPISATRYCSKDTLMPGGFIIKKGSIVMPNLYSMTVDESWGCDEDVFRPERHLDNEDRERKMFTFGFGRRKCLGESVAKVESFLFFANLLNVFELQQIEKLPPLLPPVDGLTIGPQPFRLRIRCRN